MKIDLCMWVQNGSYYLPTVLRGIEDAIPSEVVGNKILVDDHSVDNTRRIGKEFNWHIYKNTKGGIGNSANLALSKVKTPLFASFEQDVLLTRNWFSRIIKQISKPNVAVAQGWRLSTNRIMNFLHCEIRPTYSLDNNIYKTHIIRWLGGFPTNVKYGVDRLLRHRVLNAGLSWVTDPTVISNHIKPLSPFIYLKKGSFHAEDYQTLIVEGALPISVGTFINLLMYSTSKLFKSFKQGSIRPCDRSS